MKRANPRRTQRLLILGVATTLILIVLGILYDANQNLNSGPADSSGQVVQDRFSFVYQNQREIVSLLARWKCF